MKRQWITGRLACLARRDGVSMLELVIALSILSLMAMMTLTYGEAWFARASLEATGVRMVEDLRWAQESAITSGHPWFVSLSKYTPDYSVYDNTTLVSKVGFSQGVNYHAGYLQLVSGRIAYDVLGNAQTSGTVVLEDKGQQVGVTLYMGTGLESLGD